MKHIKILVLVLFSTIVLQACDVSDQQHIVDVKESAITLDLNETYALEVVVFGDAATYVQYLSSDVNVATVSPEGVVTGISRGTTSIQVRAGNGFDYVVVYVAGGSSASNNEVDEAYIVTTEVELIEAFDEGIYQITLGASIVMTNNYTLNTPFEIIFGDYSLTLDITIGQDFYGGLAFNHLEGLIDGVLDGNIIIPDGTSVVPIYYNHVDPFDLNVTWNNPYAYAYTTDFNIDMYPYVHLDGAFPISNASDLDAINSGTSHTFGLGTPYEMQAVSKGHNETYVFTNNIIGETTYEDTYYVVTFVDENIEYVYTTDWVLIEEAIKVSNHPQYFRANGLASDIPQTLLDVYSGLGLVVAEVMILDYVEFEPLAIYKEDAVLRNSVFIGNEYMIVQFNMLTPLFFDLTNVEMFELNFENIVGYDIAAIVSENVSGDYAYFYDVDFVNIYLDSSDEAPGESSVFIANFYTNDGLFVDVDFYDIVFISSNTDSSILIGYAEGSGNIEVYSSNFEGILIIADQSELGLVVGDIYEVHLLVQELYVNEVNIFNGGGETGFVGGESDDESMLILNTIYIDNSNIYAEDESGGLFGRVDQTQLEVSQIFINGVVIEIRDTQAGGLFGELDNVNMDLSIIKVTNVTLSGISQIGSLVGYVDVSTGFVFDVFVDNGNITADSAASLFIGELDSTTFTAERIDIYNSTLNIINGIGGIFYSSISNNSNVTLNRLVADNNYVDVSLDFGGVVSTLDDSYLEVNNLLLLINAVNAGTFGGIINQSMSSTVILNDISDQRNRYTADIVAGVFKYSSFSSITLNHYQSFGVEIYATLEQASVGGSMENSDLDVTKIQVTNLFFENNASTAGFVYQISNSMINGSIAVIQVNVFFEVTANIAYSRLINFVNLSIIDLDILEINYMYLLNGLRFENQESEPFVSTIDPESVFDLTFLLV